MNAHSKLDALYQSVGPELKAYLCRLVIRPNIAEELLQTTFLRALEHQEAMPADLNGQRAWLFKVASNLALDTLRRHSTKRETVMFDLREQAESNPDFVAQSEAMIGTPETKAIAREHLAACFACTLRNLSEQQAAALLLKEVHGFSLDELAVLLDATPGQVKNWLQEARAYMTERYQTTCALIAKNGVCYQCVELDGFFQAKRGNPLRTGNINLQARLDVLRDLRKRPWGKWHQMLFATFDDLQ